jgi:phosphohistidine phosphatase
MSEYTLTLLRHAKSSWQDPALTDMERPLNKRGRRDAVAMALRLQEHGATFKTIFSSPARRTRETIARMLLTLPSQEAHLTFDQGFYTFDCDGLLQAIRQLDDQVNDVMVVGHNPAMHDTLRWLTGAPIATFPTCAAAQLTLDLPRWTNIRKGSAQLNWVLQPKSATT